ncbi:TIGR03086 family metal-binding protein [Nocardioides sp. W7]|uniref:TIGR03086 family metal-binding protein n=1 Tax=Nocardioides sp. W7 TaxID=2931390 RepID=UPI001FD47D0E|nr:TIGR03086 family metal-binding protein [Nocardioides sp. W7]
MTTTTHPQIQQYLDNAALFTEVVDAGGPWDATSPCAGWSARDVLDHVVETQRSFLAQRELDLGPAPTGEPAEVWRTHLDAVRRVVADDDLVSREYDGYFGRTTIAATLATFYGFDLLVHRWDLARGLGRDTTFSDAELETIETALAGFGEHLYDDGVCAPAVPVPDDAPRQTRLLAQMGRRG